MITTSPSTRSAIAVAASGAVVLAAIGTRFLSRYLSDAYLEDVTGSRALGWVKKRNNESVSTIGDPKLDPRFTRVKAALDSKDKIPYAVKRGQYLYNVWKDDKHARGLWRRVRKVEDMMNADTPWETVLDLDELDTKEGKPGWVWKGSVALCEEPHSAEMRRALLKLSRGGADAVEVREFDCETKTFITPEQGGFFVKDAKTSVSYKSRDVLLIGTDTGAGSMTKSGYPRTVREWHRGVALRDAPIVYQGEETDVSVSSWYDGDNRGFKYEWRVRSPTFYTSENWIRIEPSNEFHKVPCPDDAEISVFGPMLLIQLRTDWTTMGGQKFIAGSLICVPLEEFCVSKGAHGKFTALFVPSKTRSMSHFSGGKTMLVIAVLDNVKSSFVRYRFDKESQTFHLVPDFPVPTEGGALQELDAWSLDEHRSDEFWLTAAGYVSPTSLFLVDASKNDAPRLIRRLPTMFDASGLHVHQHFAQSLDGTMIPYFEVRKGDVGHNNQSLTLLYGYGGFEISLLPSYSSVVGISWLERGNTYVVANIRGGGEFGPSWHQSALKEKRHKAYEDFEAVAKDLHRRGVCTPRTLGIMGGSNGGLLVGNALVRNPELYGAVVCEVPLLDMKRYTKLLAGASWIAEYGDPDKPEEWLSLQKYSPYHLIQPHTDRKYPATFFTTSTRDDRVHPGHARKMVHRLLEMGHTPLYYENMEGGHAGAADNAQTAFMELLGYRFLENVLGREGKL